MCALCDEQAAENAPCTACNARAARFGGRWPDSRDGQRGPQFRRADHAGHGRQIRQHPLHNRRLWQNRAKKTCRYGVFDQDGREILDIEIVEAIRMGFDVDPCETDLRMLIRQPVEGLPIVTTRPAPFRAQAGDEQRVGFVDALGDPVWRRCRDSARAWWFLAYFCQVLWRECSMADLRESWSTLVNTGSAVVARVKRPPGSALTWPASSSCSSMFCNAASSISVRVARISSVAGAWPSASSSVAVAA